MTAETRGRRNNRADHAEVQEMLAYYDPARQPESPTPLEAARGGLVAGGVTQRELADEYGVSGVTVHKIIANKIWRQPVEEEVSNDG